jgi:hypothetical protein
MKDRNLVIADSPAPPTKESVSLVKLSPTEWRVSDPRVSPHDASSLLGFIEARGSVFEATVLRPGVASYTTPSLSAALELFAANPESGRL